MLSIKKYGLLSVLFILSMLSFISVFSATPKQQFDINAANKRFDEINIRLSTQNLNIKNLEKAVVELEALQDQAKICVAQNQRQLDLMLAASPIKNKASQQESDSKPGYFNGEKRTFEERAANCRLFILRTKESIIAFKETISKLGVNVLLTPRMPLWGVIAKQPLDGFIQINGSAITKNLYTNKLSDVYAYILLGLLILVLIAGGYLIAILKRYYRDKTHDLVAVRMSYSLAKFIVPILFFGLASLFFAILNRNIEFQPIFERTAYALFTFSVAIAIIYYVFMSHTVNRRVFYSLTALLSYLLVCFIVWLVLHQQISNQALIDLTCIVYLILLSLISANFLFCAIAAVDSLGLRAVLRIIASCYFLAVIFSACLGYIDLSQYLISALLFTVLLCGVTWLLVKTIQRGVQGIMQRKTQMVKTAVAFLDIKRRNSIVEVFLIQAALYLIIAALFVLFFLDIWDVPQNYIYQARVIFIEGFTFSSVTISLLSIVYALLLFSLINLIGRAISALISRRHKFQGEMDTQSAVASIVTYISFSVALVAALIVLGINFTGLAIIIGALSVGIGLGLQPIVNNFVSGLVLLIEKPIKSGDRILIDNTEGFVKKVRIRSTQVMTLSKEDVIIPNSDLVTKSVTNYMFRNSNWRVTTQVGVAYGSDIELVKNILMDVSKDHELVLQEAPNQPIVLFRQFGDSSLVFELWCVIRDVNKKYAVVSDLNFKIDHAFRAAGITIAFPQRDVHIKDHTKINQSK